MTKDTCPGCGIEFESLGRHWGGYPEHRPSIDRHKMDIIVGIVMGDGTVVKESNTHNSYIKVSIKNKMYMEWLDEELGWLSNGVRLHSADGGHIYSLLTKSHQELNELREWYSTGKKRYPDDLELNREMVRHWYCCDGSLFWERDNGNYYRPCSIISCSNEIGRESFINRIFTVGGFSPSITGHNIRFSVSETERFLEIHGPPPPGFEYKWEDEDYSKYERLKEEAYNRGI